MRLFLLLILTFNLLYAQKIALLIGNDDYSFAPLSNPLNDVDGIYKTLKEIGFDISQRDVLKNASQEKMQKALANFSQRAKNAEVALIYFSGHGMQVNNKNYMLPARSNPKKPVDLFGLVDLNYFIQSATSAKYGIVLVDACRDNPLVKYFQNGKHKGTSAKKGLGQVTPTVGQVVIGFATSAGDTADDGSGDMSPYAEALSVRLKESDDIRNILGKVSIDVSSSYEQNPIYRANLASSVYLGGANNKQNITISPYDPKSKWLSPSKSQCKGGKMYKGICYTNWSSAKKICSTTGGRLPTRDELRTEVTRCGGEITTYGDSSRDAIIYKNNANKSYQDCYKDNGFTSNYWSSTTVVSRTSNAWAVDFYDGNDAWTYKSDGKLVRCVRAGQ